MVPQNEQPDYALVAKTDQAELVSFVVVSLRKCLELANGEDLALNFVGVDPLNVEVFHKDVSLRSDFLNVDAVHQVPGRDDLRLVETVVAVKDIVVEDLKDWTSDGVHLRGVLLGEIQVLHQLASVRNIEPAQLEKEGNWRINLILSLFDFQVELEPVLEDQQHRSELLLQGENSCNLEFRGKAFSSIPIFDDLALRIDLSVELFLIELHDLPPVSVLQSQELEFQSHSVLRNLSLDHSQKSICDLSLNDFFYYGPFARVGTKNA